MIPNVNNNSNFTSRYASETDISFRFCSCYLLWRDRRAVTLSRWSRSCLYDVSRRV